MTITNTSCAAKNINLVNRKAIALQVITNNQKITEIAFEKQVEVRCE